MQVAELQSLYRAVDQVRSGVDDARRRYGDIPAVRRLLGDVDRLDLDVHELDAVPARVPEPVGALEYISEEPADNAMWVDADDEGIGGYHGRSRR
jgi:hypothetical protein